MVMEDGAIKILDPYLFEFESRYNFSKGICYSPEKLSDFFRVDDEKSCIYELGMLILQIGLLSEVRNTTTDGDYCETKVREKLEEAKQLYSS